MVHEGEGCKYTWTILQQHIPRPARCYFERLRREVHRLAYVRNENQQKAKMMRTYQQQRLISYIRLLGLEIEQDDKKKGHSLGFYQR